MRTRQVVGFKSRQQMELFRKMVAEGKISQAIFESWLAKTDLVKLPERLPRPWRAPQGPHGPRGRRVKG